MTTLAGHKPPLGIAHGLDDAVCLNRTGLTLAVGDIVSLDMEHDSAAAGDLPAVDEWVEGAQSSASAVVTTTGTKNLTFSPVGVVIVGGPDGENVTVAFRKALVNVAISGATSIGDGLAAETGETLDVAAAGEKVVAIAQEAGSSGTIAAIFDGWGGYGIGPG